MTGSVDIDVNRRRIDAIQLLRAFAATAVVFTHATTRIGYLFPEGKASSHLFDGISGQVRVGDAGVDLFFVISGFVMLYVHRNDFGQPGAVTGFFKKRITRIVPLYWLLTTVAVSVTVLSPGLFTTHYAAADPAWVAGSYLFLPIPAPGRELSPVIGVGWTLNYEMFFYLVFGVLLTLPRPAALPFLLASFTVLVGLGVALAPAAPWAKFATSWLLLEFLLGIGIAYWKLSGGNCQSRPRASWRLCHWLLCWRPYIGRRTSRVLVGLHSGGSRLRGSSLRRRTSTWERGDRVGWPRYWAMHPIRSIYFRCSRCRCGAS